MRRQSRIDKYHYVLESAQCRCEIHTCSVYLHSRPVPSSVKKNPPKPSSPQQVLGYVVKIWHNAHSYLDAQICGEKSCP